MPRKDPPKEHRFKKGQSGNPGGRPRGSVNLSARIRKVLETKKKGKQLADTLAEVLIKETLRNPAKMGAFLRDFMERDEGKVSDRLEVTARPADLIELLTQLEDEGEIPEPSDDCSTEPES